MAKFEDKVDDNSPKVLCESSNQPVKEHS
uniref:Beta protein n=1 Tax=Methanothermobacter thermautotrophicus TaxID=145262 RepID=Q07301_METTF|nr:beta [Methanothermobacter thermautotrophicus]